MPQSLDKKFEGQELPMLKEINEKFGGNVHATTTMEHYGVKCDIAWGRWVARNLKRFDFKFVERQRCSIAENLMAPDVQLELECKGMSLLLRAEAKIKARIERQKKRIEEASHRYYLSQLAWGVEGDCESYDLRINI